MPAGFSLTYRLGLIDIDVLLILGVVLSIFFVLSRDVGSSGFVT